MASLIVSEAKIEAERNCDSIYLATLDSQKAFDVVDHRILLDKLYQQNVHPDLWNATAVLRSLALQHEVFTI